MPKKDFVEDNDTKNVKNYPNDIYEYQIGCSQENDEHSENKILNYIYDVFDNKFKDHINKMHEDSFLFSLDNDKSNSFLDSIQNNIGEIKDIKIYKKYENQDFEKYHESNIPNHFEQIEENKKNNNFDYSSSQDSIIIFGEISNYENSSSKPLFGTKDNTFIDEINKFYESNIPKNCQIKKEGRDIYENSGVNIINHQTPRKKIFQIIYPKKMTMFTKNDKVLLGKKKKRSSKKRKRKDNTDNKRRKIKRSFFNYALIKMLNKILKSMGSKSFFIKLSQKFVSDVSKETNKKMLNQTIKEILENTKLYDINEANNHNSNVLKNKQIQESKEMNSIIEKTYIELFEEYIKSDEFKTGEINRLRKKKMEESYIDDYIFIANHMMEFFLVKKEI
jgi:hypothetical protein